jgi:hypothetical protein
VGAHEDGQHHTVQLEATSLAPHQAQAVTGTSRPLQSCFCANSWMRETKPLFVDWL